jgi:hypothetical protein
MAVETEGNQDKVQEATAMEVEAVAVVEIRSCRQRTCWWAVWLRQSARRH